MQHTDTHAEYHRLLDIVESFEARSRGEYDPVLDDLQREAAALRWELGNA